MRRQLEICPGCERSALAVGHFTDGSGSLPVPALVSLEQLHKPLFARADAHTWPWRAHAGHSCPQEQLRGPTVPVCCKSTVQGFLTCPSTDCTLLTTAVSFREQELESYQQFVLLNSPFCHFPWVWASVCCGLGAQCYWSQDMSTDTSPWDFLDSFLVVDANLACISDPVLKTEYRTIES